MTPCDACERSPCECTLFVCDCAVCGCELIAPRSAPFVAFDEFTGRDRRGRPAARREFNGRYYCPGCVGDRRPAPGRASTYDADGPSPWQDNAIRQLEGD